MWNFNLKDLGCYFGILWLLNELDKICGVKIR